MPIFPRDGSVGWTLAVEPRGQGFKKKGICLTWGCGGVQCNYLKQKKKIHLSSETSIQAKGMCFEFLWESEIYLNVKLSLPIHSRRKMLRSLRAKASSYIILSREEY